MCRVAGENCSERTDKKYGVSWPAVKVHAGENGIHDPENRGVPAQRIDKHDGERDGEEADLAIPKPTAEQRADDQKQGDGTDVELADVLGDEKSRILPREARWPPVVLHVTRCPEQVGHEEGQQQRRVERASARADIIDLGSIRIGGQQDREQDGDDNEGKARHTCNAKRQQAPHQARAVNEIGKQPPEHIRNEQIHAQQRHLIAAEHDTACGQARCQPVPQRSPLQRAIKTEKRDGQKHKAHDLTDVLHAPGHGRAEAEDEGRQQRARPVPALIANPSDHAETAGEHGQKHGNVDGPQARTAVDQRQQQKRRREDHRLGIGDLGLAREHVGVPEGPFAACDAIGEKLDLRLEMRLGVPGNRKPPRQPWCRHDAKAQSKREGDRKQPPSVSRPGQLEADRFCPSGLASRRLHRSGISSSAVINRSSISV